MQSFLGLLIVNLSGSPTGPIHSIIFFPFSNLLSLSLMSCLPWRHSESNPTQNNFMNAMHCVGCLILRAINIFRSHTNFSSQALLSEYRQLWENFVDLFCLIPFLFFQFYKTFLISLYSYIIKARVHT